MTFEKTPTAGMEKGDWLKLRKTGIGGSDAGAICGLNPYSGRMEVFCDKTSDIVDEIDNESVRIGQDLEGYVAKRFMEATGLKVRRSNYMYRSVEHPFMIADVDRLVIGEDAGLECKTASAYNENKWKDGNIPPHYVMQCYHYMAVTGKKAWYIAAVILGRGFTYRKLSWDDGIINGLIDAEKDFWLNNVMPGVIPEPDGSEACDRALERFYHTARHEKPIALTGFDKKLERWEEITGAVDKLQEEKKKIEQEVKLFMQDHKTAASGKYRVTWGNVSSVKLDTARIKKERPDIYKCFEKQSIYRRFQIKTA